MHILRVGPCNRSAVDEQCDRRTGEREHEGRRRVQDALRGAVVEKLDRSETRDDDGDDDDVAEHDRADLCRVATVVVNITVQSMLCARVPKQFAPVA